MSYLGDAATQPDKKEFVEKNLMKIFQNIVIPNIAITAEEKDDFEEDPEQFIRNDLEEADLETRRRNCLKFVQKLSKLFQG